MENIGKHNRQDFGNYKKKRFKELAIKKVRINSSGCLNRYKLRLIGGAYPEGYWYKISSKEDVDLLEEELLIKKKRLRKT